MGVDFSSNYNEPKRTGMFRFWAQKVLPSVYDDSLSYYELLCKVVNYLNDVIINVDTANENVAGLHESYNQLQAYVNHYFDNLDVQNEINNKLDDMSRRGELSALIQPLIDEFSYAYYHSQIAQDNEINALKARMNEFTALAEGSTTGDAELVDIRVGANGKSYSSAGQSVREQFNTFKYDHCELTGVNLVKIGELKTGWINQSGDVLETAGSLYVTAPVKSGEVLNVCVGSVSEVHANRLGGYVFLNEAMQNISVVNIQEYATAEVYNGFGCASIPVPASAKYVRCTIKLGTTWDATGTMILTHATFEEAENPQIMGIGGFRIYHPDANAMSGKTWAVVGDSLTERNLRTTKAYFDYVSEKTGISVINMGSSGTGYKRAEDEGKAFYQRIVNVPANADVVTIFGSGNDLQLISSLGSPTDSGTDTICGCINTTIDSLYNVHPTVQLGIVSPTPWAGNEPSDNGSMVKYCEALEAICKNRGVPYLDLFHCSGLRPNDETFRSLAYSKDDGNGVHPDETGHKIISSRFLAFLNTLIGTY